MHTHTHTHTHIHTHTHTHITVRAHREYAHTQGTLYVQSHIQQAPQCASCKTCSFVYVHIQMGSTENKHQRKLQRVKTILGTSRSRMQSRKVVRLVPVGKLVRLLYQRVRIATAVFFVLTSTINTIAASVNLQITFTIRRIVAGETIFYVVSVFSHLYTSVPLVTSRWTA